MQISEAMKSVVKYISKANGWSFLEMFAEVLVASRSRQSKKWGVEELEAINDTLELRLSSHQLADCLKDWTKERSVSVLMAPDLAALLGVGVRDSCVKISAAYDKQI